MLATENPDGTEGQHAAADGEQNLVEGFGGGRRVMDPLLEGDLMDSWNLESVFLPNISSFSGGGHRTTECYDQQGR